MASSALASTQWVTSKNALYDGRSEGLAEETGEYILTNNVAGTTNATNYFVYTYSQPLVAHSAYLKCSGIDFPSGCGSEFTVTTGFPTAYNVTVTFASTFYFSTTGDIIELIVRVNAAAAGVGCLTAPANGLWPSSGPGVITAVVDADQTTSAPTGISVTGTDAANTYAVLYVRCTPNLSLTMAAKDKDVNGANGLPGQVLNCIGTKDLGPYDNSFCVNIDEEFVNALTSYSYELASDPDATNGTQVILTLTDVPLNMKINSPTVTDCNALDHHDPNYCNKGYWTGSSWVWTYTGTLDVSAGSVSCTPDSPAPTPPTQTCTVTLTVNTEDAGSPENFDVCFTYKTHGPLPTGYVEIYADIQKGPLTPSTDIPLFNGTYEIPQPGLSVVDFSDCQTVLLYPYVTSQGIYGYDTGIAVANTTLDPFDVPPPAPNFPNLIPTYGKGSAVPQTGDCYYYIYSGGALTAWYDTGAIVPGSVDAFFLSAVAPGISGAYAIAVCEFLDAHGFAEIQYDAGLYTGFAVNYIADVLPDPAFYTRKQNLLGESAVTQYYLNNFFKYLLIYDPPKH